MRLDWLGLLFFSRVYCMYVQVCYRIYDMDEFADATLPAESVAGHGCVMMVQQAPAREREKSLQVERKPTKTQAKITTAVLDKQAAPKRHVTASMTQ